MSFFSRFFNSNKSTDNSESVSISQETESTKSKEGNTGENDANRQSKNVMPEDLPTGIKLIISERGENILNENIFINMLDDYNLFLGQRFIKNVLRQIQQGDYISRIVSSMNWDLDSKTLIANMVSDFGVQERIANYLIMSLGYGVGHTSIKPILAKEEEISFPKESFTVNSNEIEAYRSVKKLNIDAHDKRPSEPYDHRAELLRYKNPQSAISNIEDGTTLYKTLSAIDMSSFKIPLIGQDQQNNSAPEILDLTDIQHILIAGTTMSGKSTLIHSMMASMIIGKHPSELKFLLMDGNGLEFSSYEKMERQFLTKTYDLDSAIITQQQDGIESLKSLTQEIENRWRLFKLAGVRNIEYYNEKFTQHRLDIERGHFYMPYIVLIIDEYSPFMQYDSKTFEDAISKIGQKGPTAGVHMIISTNQVAREILTPIIRQQFPMRAVFRTLSAASSRLLIYNGEATKLPARGKYLLGSVDGNVKEMITPLSTYSGIDVLTEHISNQVGYPLTYYLPIPKDDGNSNISGFAGASMDRDGLFDEAARFVVSRNCGSTSAIQRQYNIGYNQAGRIMDQLEAAGIVGPANGAKPRNILVDSIALERILSQR